MVSTDCSRRRVFGWASRRVAILLSLFVVALWVAALPLAAWVHQLNGGLVSYLLLLVPFTAVGALLAVRVPSNPIGWIFLLVSLGLLLGQDAASYAVRAYRIDGHGLPLSRLAVAVATGWVSFALLPLPILLFPDGRVSGRGWRWTLRVYLAVAAIAVGGVGVHDLGAFTDAQIHVDSSGELAGGTPPVFVKAVGAVALATLAIIAGAWVVRLLRRYRSATGDLREQLKWLISGGGLCIFGFVISILLNNAHSEPWYAIAQAAPFSVAALPLSIGVGVLKYRLYEIDRLISPFQGMGPSSAQSILKTSHPVTKAFQLTPVAGRQPVAGNAQQLARRQVEQIVAGGRQLCHARHRLPGDNLAAQRAQVRRQRIGYALAASRASGQPTACAEAASVNANSGGQRLAKRQHRVRRHAAEDGRRPLLLEPHLPQPVRRPDAVQPKQGQLQVGCLGRKWKRTQQVIGQLQPMIHHRLHQRSIRARIAAQRGAGGRHAALHHHARCHRPVAAPARPAA